MSEGYVHREIGNSETGNGKNWDQSTLLLGTSEMKWKGAGQISSDEQTVYFSGHEKNKVNGVGFICDKRLAKCVLGFNPISDRVISIRLQCKPANVTLIQLYAPTSDAEDEVIDNFYECIQQAIKDSSSRDVQFNNSLFASQIAERALQKAVT